MKPFAFLFFFFFLSISIFSEDEPCHIVFIVDCNDSEDGFPKEFCLSSIRQFSAQLSSEDSTALISFDSSVRVVQELTTDRNLFHQALMTLESGRNPYLYDSLAKAVQLLQNETGKGMVVLITDNEDHGSTFQFREIEQMYLSFKIPLFSFGMGNPDSHSIPRLARSTGGEHLSLSSVRDFSPELMDSMESLHKRYPSLPFVDAQLGAIAGLENKKSSGAMPVLTVESTPLNSAVYIDGRFEGFSSNRPSRGSDHSNQLQLQNISPGEHQIRIVTLPALGHSPEFFEFTFSMGNMNAYINATVIMRRATIIHSNGRRELIQPNALMDIQNSLDKFDRMFD